jgi:DNA polymerase-3 subunit epsilon
VVVFEGGQPVHEWSQLLCPEGVDWNNADVHKALEINHIDRKDLTGRPTFSQVLPNLLMEFSHDVWAAHNASFDMRMLSQELQRLNRPALSPKMLVCTLDLARHIGGAGNKLAEVAARYDVAMEDAHRAAVDARTCGLILGAMLRRGLVPREDAAMAALTKTVASRRRW